METLGNKQIDLELFFGSGGNLAQVVDNFESRPEQLKMAFAVSRAFDKGYKLAVEAGTGTGKSFAYLAAAIEYAVQKGCKVIISTHTINLQEQLIDKDIPQIAAAVPYGFKAVLAKGRGNYICLRRLNYAVNNSKSLFEDGDAALTALNKWAKETKDGTTSSLAELPRLDIWDMVKSEHGNCKGRRCSSFNQCFYWTARRNLENADIIVANHSLLFSDLSMKARGIGILPEYEAVIIDEAHNVEQTAEDHFGINLSNRNIGYLITNLYNEKTKKGVLAGQKIDDIVELIANVKKCSKTFFEEIETWYQNTYSQNNGKCNRDFVEDILSEAIKKLRLAVSRRLKYSDDNDEYEDRKLELERCVERLNEIEADIRCFVNQPETEEGSEHIYWVELSGARYNRRCLLRSAPVYAGNDIRRCLFDNFNSVILTSATLSCGSEDKQFAFFASRIGLDNYNTLMLGSPFDYENQVTLYVESSLPEPNCPDFQTEAIETIKKYLLKTQGKAFVLFTSYTMLRSFADQMAGWLAANDFTLLEQGGGINRSELLREFREDTNSVLFGTDSFWQGVDVPGQSLSNVIILRLPFAVPNHPLIQGKIEKIRKEGGNPFIQYQLPAAIIKFKQGFGRLVRKQADTGIVVVLDSRIITKYYGKKFFSAIPPCRVEIV